MESIMEQFLTIIANNTVSVPILLFIIGLILGLKPGKAFRAGLITSVALTGIWTILTLFMDSIGPVVTAIGEEVGNGLKFTYLDVGWAARFASGFAPIALSYVGIGIVLNLVLVLVRFTKTLSIEFIGPILANGTIGYAMYLYTGNYWLGLIASTIIFLVSWKLNDWQTPMVEKFFGFKNIALITVGVNEVGLLTWPITKLLDRIPGLSTSRFTPEWVNQKFGVFGEPMFIGAVFGVALGIAGGYTISDTLVLAATLAAVLNILPRMVGILMEGLVPIQEGLRDWLKRRATGREIYIGMDPAIGTGHPAILATAMLMIPVALILSIILPGNHLLPLADLAVLPFTMMFIVIMNRGDLLRSFIVGTIFMVFVIYGANWDAPYMTMVMVDQGLVAPGTQVANLTAGAVPYTALFAWIFRLFGFGG